MKTVFLLLISLLFAFPGLHAQQQQQTDSTPPAQGWIKLNTGTTAGFSAVDPHGSDTVYASGSTLLRSTDGGTSWQTLPAAPASTGILLYLDDTTGLLAAPNDSVYKTIDGAQTWKARGIGYSGTVLFHGHDTGWTFNEGYLSRTIDGGNTWQNLGLALSDINTCIAFAPDGKHGFSMGAAQYWAWRTSLGDVNFTAANFERTTDGGRTWSDLYYDSLEKPQLSTTQGYTFVPWDVQSIAAVSPLVIIAVGGGVARSTDGGDNWDTVAHPEGGNWLFGVSFPDSMHGTAVGMNGVIIHTSDAGNTWEQQNSGITGGSYLLHVEFTDSLHGYVSGEKGIILKTDNGGLSWVRISLLSNQLQDNSFPNPANGETSISYNLPCSQHVDLNIQNMTGFVVQTPLTGSFQSQGDQRVSLDTSGLASGTYTYTLRTEKYFATGKIEVIH